MKSLKLIKSQKAFLLRLSNKNTSKLQAQWLLDNCSSAQVKVLSEICLNVLKGTIELNSDLVGKLGKHKSCLRILGSLQVKQHTLRRKRECLKDVNLILLMLKAAMTTLQDIFKHE